MFERRLIFVPSSRGPGLAPVGAAIALLVAVGLLELAIAFWPSSSPALAARPASCEPGAMAPPGRPAGAHAETARVPAAAGTWM